MITVATKQVFIIRAQVLGYGWYEFASDWREDGPMLFESREAAEAHLATFRASELARHWDSERFGQPEVAPLLVACEGN